MSNVSSGNFKNDGTITAAGKGAVCIPTLDRNQQFRKLKALRENQTCFDCPNTRPTWASVTYGKFQFLFVMCCSCVVLCYVLYYVLCIHYLMLFVIQSLLLTDHHLPSNDNQSGVFLCLDCSSTHRSMGVHLTFVRSVDLDEWTQRQMDCMGLGGNGNARAFFRKHGFTELYGAKAEKKYKSKAAIGYKAELQKLIDAAAARRGEAVGAARDGAGTDNALHSAVGDLLENLQISERKAEQELAQQKLAEARVGSSAGTLTASAKLASAMPGASRLTVPSGGMLRKPASAGGKFLKKPATSTSKLRVNKLSMNLPSNGIKDNDFEDIEATQKASADTEKEAKQLKVDEAMAKNLQIELEVEPPTINAIETPVAPVPVVAAPPVPAPSVEKKAEAPKKPTMKDNVSKLQAMNKDFFSQF